jgi:hypothetical protein
MLKIVGDDLFSKNRVPRSPNRILALVQLLPVLIRLLAPFFFVAGGFHKMNYCDLRVLPNSDSDHHTNINLGAAIN